MAYMFQAVDENETEVITGTDATNESMDLRRGAQLVFVGSACLLPWMPPVAVFGMIASGALILATKPAAACQEEISTEIQRKNFGCAWAWWLVMAAIVIGLTYIGMAGGAMVYMEMRGIQ